MDWYYAINGQRVGPVSESNFAQLVANGVITEDTLVWRKGMAQWVRWDAIAPTVELPAAERISTTPGLTGEAAPEAEAEADTTETWTTDEFWAQLEDKPFVTSIGGCLGRAWNVYRSAFWPCLGVTALAYLILIVVGFIPLVGFLSVFFVTPQITAGLYWYFVQRMRGESPGVETLFMGFQQRLMPLAKLGVAQLAIAFVPLSMMMMLMGSMGLLDAENPPEIDGTTALWGGAGLAGLVLLMMWVYLRLMLAHIILMDLNSGVREALKLSWRIVGRKIWTAIGLIILMMLLAIAGTLALFVGLLLVMPMYSALFAQLYEDARNSALGRPPAE